MTFRRYDDGCYAVTVGRKRGPIGHDKPTARRRYMRSGLIAPAAQHGKGSK